MLIRFGFLVRVILVFLTPLFLVACEAEEQAAEVPEVVRGLKTVLIKDQENFTVRRYPSVLQPAEVVTASFEIPGKVGPHDLKVGQVVKKGELLVSLDKRTLEIQIENSKAAIDAAKAAAKNAADSYTRLSKLLKKKVTTRANVDAARAQKDTTSAQLVQAKKNLETAEEELRKADLRSPIDGVINTVEIDPFVNVRDGATVVTLYQTSGFEISFSVSYDIISRMAVGKKAKVKLADNPDVVLASVVSELGTRADTVSSFPVIVMLNETRPELKAGMAVEVSMKFPVTDGSGYLLPISVMPMKGQLDPNAGPDKPVGLTVFVYDPDTSTVKEREVMIAGVRKNRLIVASGVEAGERVASAGVSFLREGQKVKLLPDQ